MKGNISGKSFVIMLLLLSSGGVLGMDECKVNLLQFFGLTASKYPVPSTMIVCGGIDETCCSMEDELRIHSLWQKYSNSQIRRHIDQLIKAYELLFQRHDELLEISPKKIDTNSTEWRKIPIKFKVCERIAREVTTNDDKINSIDLLNNNSLIDDPKFRKENLLKAYDDNRSEGDGMRNSAYERKLEEIAPQTILSDDNIKKLAQSEVSVISVNEKKNYEVNNTQKSLKLTNQSTPVADRKLKENKDDRKLAYDPIYYRPFYFKEELPERKIQCSYTTKIVNKKVTFVNKAKKKFCKKIRKKMHEFPITDFRDYLPMIRVEMIRLLSMKKTFYCSLCDMDKQKRIDPYNKIITFDTNFCRRIIVEFKDYLKFTNVLLIEYLDMLLQYVRCFQTPADEARFPYSSFLQVYQKNFEVIQKCFDNIDTPEYMQHCIFLCQQYSYTTYSPFFDGSVDLISRINTTLISFFRKVYAKQALNIDKKSIQDEFDLIDSVDFNEEFTTAEAEVHEERGDDEVRGKHQQKTLGEEEGGRKLKKEKNNLMATHAANKDQLDPDEYHKLMIQKTYDKGSPVTLEHEVDDDTDSIFEMKTSKPISKIFRSRFVNDSMAINPIVLVEETNFDIKIKDIIKLQCHKDKEKKKRKSNSALSRAVLLDYFKANEDDIKDFQSDLFMPFTDYAFFKVGEENGEKKDLKI